MKKIFKMLPLRGLLLFFLLISAFVSDLYSNDSEKSVSGHAVLVQNPGPLAGPVLANHQKFIGAIAETPKVNFTVYKWDESSNQVQLDDFRVQREIPVKYVHFLIPDLKFHTNPDLVFKTDTAGIVKQVYIEYSAGMTYTSKTIDLTTYEILSIKEIVLAKHETALLNIPDFKKYFKTDPALMKKKDLNKFLAAQAKVLEAYKDVVWAKKSSVINPPGLTWSFHSSYFTNFSDLLYPVDNKIYSDKKDKSKVKIRYGENAGIDKNDVFKLCNIVEIGDFKYLSEQMQLSVKSVGEEETYLGAILMGSKKLNKLIGSGTSFYAVRGEKVSDQFSYIRQDDPVRILVEKDCFRCAVQAEKELSRNPAIQLLERKSAELEYFSDLLKKEEFSDYDLASVQYKLIGADLIIKLIGKGIEIIDIKTGRNILTSQNTLVRSENGYIRGITQPVVMEMLSEYNPDRFKLTWVATTAEKNGKINEAVIYHSAGLDSREVYEIFTYESIEVGGEILQKKEPVAKIRTLTGYAYNIAPVKVYEGKERLFTAINEGKTLHLTRKP